MRHFSSEEQPKSGFFDFLKNVEKVDEEVAQAHEEAQVEAQLDVV
jgi:hypothetical protein